MKKILLAAVAALAITSCSQNEEFESPAGKSPIVFKSVVGKSTRAAEAKDADLQKAGYKVYGYNTAGDGMASDVTLGKAFMDAQASYSAGWSLTGGPYYWPLTDKIQFFAYSSPKDVVTGYSATTGYPSFSYTVQAVADQEDLLVAHAPDKVKADGDVNLNFGHALTQVNFKLKGDTDGADYSVTSITIKGALPTGTFTYAADKGVWTGITGTSVDYAYAITNPTEFTGKGDKVIATATNAFMLMPQPLASVTIEVAYTATLGSVTTFSGTKSVALTGSWETGKKILYTLVLPSDATEMNLVPKVGEWDTETSEPDKTPV